MEEIKLTLIGDGSSDKALIPIIKWLLDDLFPQIPNQIYFADFSELKNPPAKNNIQGQVNCAKEYFPFDFLIYHRDAETNNFESIEMRKNEVLEKIENIDRIKTICLIPIKMMETWLLIDIEAIKKAAGNRNYRGELQLPPINRLESYPRPKEFLLGLLKNASGLKGRRLSNFNERHSVHLVSENIEDFSILRRLNTFLVFENDLKNAIERIIQIQT